VTGTVAVGVDVLEKLFNKLVNGTTGVDVWLLNA
jgi:hypothetical protein